MRLLFIFLILLMSGFVGCTVQKSAYIKDGKEYGVTGGLFKGRWWHYYERGLSFAEGGFYKEAIDDLHAAIERRHDDQWRSRTYGMHVVDYFSHRELGIIYFKLEKYHEAVAELEDSLRTAESAKAKYFLNKARRAILEESGADALPPLINIVQPSVKTVTNKFTVTLKGEAEDDFFVSSLSVNDAPLLLELSAGTVPFEQEVPLKQGTNEISIRVSDLTGKTTEKILKVEADREGPVIIIDEERLAGRRVVLAGYITDRSGIASFSINDREIPITDGRSSVGDASEAYVREMEFHQEIDIPEDEDTVRLLVRDIAENITRGAIQAGSIDQGMRKPGAEDPLSHMPLLAAVFQADEKAGPAQYALMDSIKQILDHTSPVIRVNDMSADQTVYTDSLFLEGSVSDASNITSLFINGESALIRKGKKVFFNYLTPLGEGENTFIITAGDTFGNRAEKVITVNRVVPKIRKLGSRMTISILPLESRGVALIPGDTVIDSMINAFVKQERFQIIERERMREVLRELKLSQTVIVDPDTASKVGRIVVADAMLTGSVHETENSIEILTRLVDTETSHVIDAEDVFSEDKSLRGISSLVHGLALKYKQNFPLLEGSILKKDGTSVLIDLGSDKKIRKNMSIIMFREGEAVTHPDTGRILGTEPKQLGEAKVEDVYEGFSRAVIKKGRSVKVDIRDKIITK